MKAMCDHGCGRAAEYRWEGKRLCWPCKEPLLRASSRLALRTLAGDKRFAAALSAAAGVNVTIEVVEDAPEVMA